MPQNQNIPGYVEGYISVFRTVFENLFVKKNHQINAVVVINKLKQEPINVPKLKEFFDTLPKEEWNLKIFFDHLKEINEIFQISDEHIREWALTTINDKDLQAVRWEILIESMLEYTRFSTEFYDGLKYNKAPGLSQSRLRLMNELMLVFKLIKDQSKELYERYKDKKFNKRSMIKFNEKRIPIEFLMLRILYIILNLQKADDKNLSRFAELLGKERIALQYDKKRLPKYN